MKNAFKGTGVIRGGTQTNIHFRGVGNGITNAQSPEQILLPEMHSYLAVYNCLSRRHKQSN